MKPLLDYFQDELVAIIDKYREEGMTLAEVVGTLETVKLNLWSEQCEQENESDIL